MDGVFLFVNPGLCGAEYGMRLCVLVQSVGDQACPELVNGICKADRAIGGHLSFIFLFLSIRMVLLVFQAFGVKPVAHKIVSMFMVSWISAESMRRRSLTIPSDPGGLLLLRVLMHSIKALF